MPIRWRLTLWFALILCVILILSGIVIHTFLQRYLSDQIDSDLKVYSAQVHGTFHPNEISTPLDYKVFHDELPAVNEFASPGIYIQIIDQNGNVVVKTDNLGSQELPVNLALIEEGFDDNVVIRTVAAGNNTRIRMMVSPLFLGDETLLLEVAQSLSPLDATMNQVRWAIIASILTALVLASIVGSIIVRYALAPVRKITTTASAIENSSDLNQRVGHTGPKDEIGQLADTFDHMIEHLNTVFESQKHFVADASHELRTPLTVIKGNIDLLKKNISEQDRKVSLSEIESETSRMVKIANDLLILAELESFQSEKQETVLLKDIAIQELKRVQSITEDRQFNIRRAEELKANVVVHRIKQLLVNLLDNAVRYTPKGGTITISIYQQSDWACLDVTDNGSGIASEHLSYIFDRFYRVDKAHSRSSGGTGLGLSIVAGIARQHAGKITVESTPDKGTTFTLWLKLY
ncbi:MAG: HAMP domain-containing protein [Chloroflexi bacterium]|jgi:two-component system, OmpR family, sensor kinase|nr:HAMP domain-containing protein [Chloroflexota bacterium]MBT7082000.1 HAMP domain-containing protein [Chloroflexota bacterium]MBT7290726.1 HAMP domain-containing protein [Chloroflexota bacterium]